MNICNLSDWLLTLKRNSSNNLLIILYENGVGISQTELIKVGEDDRTLIHLLKEAVRISVFFKVYINNITTKLDKQTHNKK